MSVKQIVFMTILKHLFIYDLFWNMRVSLRNIWGNCNRNEFPGHWQKSTLGQTNGEQNVMDQKSRYSANLHCLILTLCISQGLLKHRLRKSQTVTKL